MRILDLEGAATCAEMRTAFNKLRLSSDPRARDFADGLRAEFEYFAQRSAPA